MSQAPLEPTAVMGTAYYHCPASAGSSGDAIKVLVKPSGRPSQEFLVSGPASPPSTSSAPADKVSSGSLCFPPLGPSRFACA